MVSLIIASPNVGRGFPPSLKLRRTTVALAQVVKPRHADPEGSALHDFFTSSEGRAYESVGRAVVVPVAPFVVGPTFRSGVGFYMSW